MNSKPIPAPVVIGWLTPPFIYSWVVNNVTEVVFDEDCTICQACADWLTRRDQHHQLRCTPSSRCTWSDAGAMPFTTTLVVRTSSGQTFFASSAVAASLGGLAGIWGIIGRWALFLNRSTLLRSYHDRWYYALARRRVAISNGLVRIRLFDQSCRVPKK